MSGKLKLGAILDDKPIKMTVELPAETHRMLEAYSVALKLETGQPTPVARLVPEMVRRFMETDRAFARSRRRRGAVSGAPDGARP